MSKGLVWVMTHVFGNDWSTMNVGLGDGFQLNVPLSLFFTLLFTVLVNALIYCIQNIWGVSMWRQGYDAGYGDGMHSKACKLAQRRYSIENDVVLMVLDKKEIDEDFDEASARHE